MAAKGHRAGVAPDGPQRQRAGRTPVPHAPGRPGSIPCRASIAPRKPVISSTAPPISSPLSTKPNTRRNCSAAVRRRDRVAGSVNASAPDWHRRAAPSSPVRNFSTTFYIVVYPGFYIIVYPGHQRRPTTNAPASAFAASRRSAAARTCSHDAVGASARPAPGCGGRYAQLRRAGERNDQPLAGSTDRPRPEP